MTVRSVRNNNPGNLDRGQNWQGEMPEAQKTPEQKAETRFEVFKSAEWGFRALCKVLLAYEDKHGLHTVRQIIDRWAPPVENPTQNYIARVDHDLGKGPDDQINLHDFDTLWKFAKAISVVEAGGLYYNDEQIKGGAKLALQG